MWQRYQLRPAGLTEEWQGPSRWRRDHVQRSYLPNRSVLPVRSFHKYLDVHGIIVSGNFADGDTASEWQSIVRRQR